MFASRLFLSTRLGSCLVQSVSQSVSQSETCLKHSILENFRTQSLLRTLAIGTIPNLPCIQNIKVCLASQTSSRFPER